MDALIITYLSGEATEEEIKQLHNWMKECPENRHYFLELREIWLASEVALTTKSKSKAAFSNFKKKVIHEEKKQTRLTWSKYAAAAALLIVGSLSFYLSREQQSPITESTVPATPLVCQSTGESRKTIILPDGSSVQLNMNSTLSYPEHFSTGERVVELEGEGYFEVVHNDAAPFYVCTPNMKVKVLGTHFDVQSYINKAVSETVLLSGKVEVQMITDNKKLLLSPNERITFDKQAQAYSLDKINATEYAIWTQDKLTMNNEELGTILRKLSRWYNIDINCQEGIPVHSKFSITIREESKEEVMRLLSIVAPINYTIENDKITLRRR